MIKRMRWYLWILLGIILAYLAVSVYFMEHFFLGTTVNGRNAEFSTVEEVDQAVLEQANTYQLTLIERGGEEVTLSKEDLGVTFTKTDAVRQVKRLQNGFLWPRMFWRQDSYQIVAAMSLDETALLETVNGLACVKNGIRPKDAYVELTETGYELHPEVEGSWIEVQELDAQVKAAVYALTQTLDLDAAGCYAKPSVTTESPEITSLVETLDTWLGAEITYEFGADTEVIDGTTIIDFISLDGFEASLDADAVTAWVSALANATDTYKKSRSFQSTLRGAITVSGGNYGWQMDQETESAALLESIQKGEVVSKAPAYSHEALVRSSINQDIGTTYIEVDMGAQHMWAYKNGNLVVDTDVVTGNISRNYGTPAIVASIQYKQRNAVLRGADYETPVNFWMPFYGNYGIHDATWRSAFGGEIYLTSGSHGCVNTPYSAMKVIFENMDAGTPVVLYY